MCAVRATQRRWSPRLTHRSEPVSSAHVLATIADCVRRDLSPFSIARPACGDEVRQVIRPAQRLRDDVIGGGRMVAAVPATEAIPYQTLHADAPPCRGATAPAALRCHATACRLRTTSDTTCSSKIMLASIDQSSSDAGSSTAARARAARQARPPESPTRKGPQSRSIGGSSNASLRQSAATGHPAQIRRSGALGCPGDKHHFPGESLRHAAFWCHCGRSASIRFDVVSTCSPTLLVRYSTT
jgi:hypothetical protein